MDIKQAVDACAALTLGKDMVFRGILIHLLIVGCLQDLIKLICELALHFFI